MNDETKFSYPDVLADRYATAPCVNIWSPYNKVVLERKFWVVIMKAQRELGLKIPAHAIKSYERHIYDVDFKSIKKWELETHQDVQARIKEFNFLAGYDVCHGAMTSRDLTDNVEQLQIRDSMLHARDRCVAVLARFNRRAQEFAILDLCGRSHNVPGQAITFGKRFSNYAEEMLKAFNHLLHVIDTYPLRGIKGPMGTQQDMVKLLGSAKKAAQLEDKIRNHLGFKYVLTSVGQVYPRSLDFEVLSALMQLCSAPGNFAKMIRLMAGIELAHEGFKEGQTASSGMPHKMNQKTCERINGFISAIRAFVGMAMDLIGDQWFEGDVSCSLIRRVALPGAFFAFDGLCESVLTVLDEMEVFPEMVRAELDKYLPFLSSSRILTEAFKSGMGNREAHALIKKHATAAVTAMRQGKGNRFVENLGADRSFPLSVEDIRKIVSKPDHGRAVEQIVSMNQKITAIARKHPTAASYIPQPVL